MIKLLSFKTRRPDLTPATFRSHYEERHVPLGLSFIDHFRWRKYVRNYVVSPVLGSVDFDCVTEFWVADREDRERTSEFAASPAFSVLDHDDRQFLDVTQRLSFEVEERVLAGSKSGSSSLGTDRLAMFIERPGPMPAADFAAGIVEQALSFSTTHGEVCDGIVLDLRRPGSSEEVGIHAILSVWLASARNLGDLAWPEVESPTRVVRLESVQTPSEVLYSGRESDRGIARGISMETAPHSVTKEEEEPR